MKEKSLMDIYQQSTREFIKYPHDQELYYLTLGLTSEVGEVADKLKKSIRDGHELDVEGVAYELGDCLFYLARLADHFKFNLSKVADMNMQKLSSRKSRNKISGSGDDR